MKRIGFQPLTAMFFSNSAESTGTTEINSDGCRHDRKTPERRFDMRLVRNEPVNCFPNDPGARDEEENCLQQRGDIFDFSVPVAVFFVRGSIGDADGEIGEQCSDQVKAGVCCFGKNAKTVCLNPHEELDTGEEYRCRDRCQCDVCFFAVGFFMKPLCG